MAGMSNLSMTNDSVLRCNSMCTRGAEYSFHNIKKFFFFSTRVEGSLEARALASS